MDIINDYDEIFIVLSLRPALRLEALVEEGQVIGAVVDGVEPKNR